MIDSNVTGIANAARKMPITAYLQTYERNDGRNTRGMYRPAGRGSRRPASPASQSFFTCRQKMRTSEHDQDDDADDDHDEATGWAVLLPRFSLNDPGTERKR